MGTCVRARPLTKYVTKVLLYVFVVGKKKSTPSDESKIRILHPDHVRVMIGDLSDGFAGTGESDEEMSEAEEEGEEESEEVCV